MIEELYINGKSVDIETVDIVRRYLSPYFQDVNALMNDSTYTIKLPMTEKNMAAFGYMNREDMNTSIPYDFLRADYYVNGLPIIVNGQARVLEVSQSIDIQITYGINRAKYAPLFKRKLNEITVRGGITASDWVVNWNRAAISVTGKKYKYIDYVSGEREADLVVYDESLVEILMPKPYKGHEKQMTMHPYIAFGNILDLIITDHNIDNPSNTIAADTFNLLKTNVADKGLILGGNKGVKSFEKESVLSTTTRYNAGQNIDLKSYTAGTFIINSTIDAFALNQLTLYNGTYPLEVVVDVVSVDTLIPEIPDPKLPHFIKLVKFVEGTTWDVVQELPYTMLDEDTSKTDTTITIDAKYGEIYAFVFDSSSFNGTSGGVYIQSGSTITIKQTVNSSFYRCSDTVSGHYDCLLNLPDMTAMEFIQEMMVLSGCGVSYDNDGKMTFVKLDSLNLSQSYNWTNKISLIQSGVFKFNNMAQRNRIAYANSQNVNHVCEGFINVSDLTLDEQQDMYVLKFNAPDKNPNGLAEFILYKQKITEQTSGVSFANEYIEKPSVAVYDNSGDAIVEIIKPNDIGSQVGFINANYINFKKITNRPMAKDVEVNIDFFTSANLDLKKAVYVGEWGKYCIVLELNAPNKEVATAKLLLINQSL